MSSKGFSQAKLNKVVQEIQDRRKQVFETIDAAALDAAKVTVSALTFYGEDPHEFESQKIRMKAADTLLDMAGFKVQRVEHSGSLKFEPFKVSREGEEGTA